MKPLTNLQYIYNFFVMVVCIFSTSIIWIVIMPQTHTFAELGINTHTFRELYGWALQLYIFYLWSTKYKYTK